MSKMICVWGDSIAMGALDSEKGGRVNRLHNDLFTKTDDEYGNVYNLGIDGDTSTGVLKRFAVEAEARETNVVIFAIGTNDCNYTAGRTYVVPVENFRTNMIELIKQARKFTNKIAIIGLITCDETKTIPIPRIPELSQDKEAIILYNNLLKEIATQEKVVFVDVLDIINNEDLEDGMHPTPQGHEKMHIRIRDILSKNNII